MNVLVVDLTHGGFKIISELIDSNENHFQEFWAWDIYNTLKPSQKSILVENGVKLIPISGTNSTEIKEIIENRANFQVIAPIHCPLHQNFGLKPDLTHHQAVKLILNNWKKSRNVPVVEVTGVKGKTSAVGMLKKMFSFKNPLILSSLGAEILSADSRKVLKKNISITPANIIETVQMAEKLNLSPDQDYGLCIFETSLGGTGMADVGVLTNIAENYSIAQGSSNASAAKTQIFQSNITCCEYDTLTEFYQNLKQNSDYIINTFSLKDPGANLKVLVVDYGLKQTKITLKVKDLKTINGNILNQDFTIKTFAPAPYHVNNVLAAVSAALTLDLSIESVQNGIKNFSGQEGRTSLKLQNNITIIEEINPGINVNAIENIINMAHELDNSLVILGGQYGITCEEIDELKAAQVLDRLINEINLHLVLTDELGKGILEKMNDPPDYVPEFHHALTNAMQKEVENIIVIYRSNYSNLKQR